MKIKFLASNDDYAAAFDPPVPASTMIPDWYKKQEPYVDNDRGISNLGLYGSTVKHCMPVLDAMAAGYIVRVPCDIHVTGNNATDGITTAWPVDRKIIDSHSAGQVSQYSIDTSVWNPAVLKMINEWTIVTPPGYSTLFTAPLWSEEKRFMAFSGVVDTDKYPQPVNFPFLVRNGFVGTIENGTPFMQLIPFKRDEWESEVGVNTEKNRLTWLRATRNTIHRYKHNFRSIKKWG
jgi:hypothetical protein